MRRRLASAAAALLLLGVSGCADDGPPGADVPELSVQLARVDSAVQARDWAEARTAVKDLIARTTLAQQAGDISDAEAAGILGAARQLLAGMAVPKPARKATPSATPSHSPATTATPTAPSRTPSTRSKKAPKKAPAKHPHKPAHRGKGKKR